MTVSLQCDVYLLFCITKLSNCIRYYYILCTVSAEDINDRVMRKKLHHHHQHQRAKESAYCGALEGRAVRAGRAGRAALVFVLLLLCDLSRVNVLH